jgi:Tol biopolymer transport system component
VLALPSGVGAAEPAWSPDGSRMVFATCTGLGAVNADGTGFHMLTNAPPCATGLVDTTPFLDTTPCWSPDGTKIVFARIVPVFFGLDLHIEYPELWARKSAPPTNLWSINADGTGQTRLTDVPSYDTDPIWLPAR